MERSVQLTLVRIPLQSPDNSVNTRAGVRVLRRVLNCLQLTDSRAQDDGHLLLEVFPELHHARDYPFASIFVLCQVSAVDELVVRVHFIL